ncbi:MAG: galactose oxidase-like domain-containing protein [Actinomycetota bacterium]
MPRKRHSFAKVASISVVVAMLWGLGIMGQARASSSDPAPSDVGAWSSPFTENGHFLNAPPSSQDESKELPTAVSSIVLPSGKILYWNGLEGTEDLQKPIAVDGGHDSLHHSRTRLLDLGGTAPAWNLPFPEDGGGGDLFCSDQRLLIDGTVMAVGGTEWANSNDITVPDGSGSGPIELLGRKNARIYHPSETGGGTWTQAESMHYGRWYPTLITLPDGKLLVASGVSKLLYNDQATNVHNTETFDPATGHWTDNGDQGATPLPLFARLHLLPNGKVFYDGTGQMWGPFGQGYDEVLWNMQKWYDPATGSWEDKGLAEFGARSGAFSVMLPLKPGTDGNYNKASILIAGGTLGTSPGSYIANSISEIVDVNGNDITRSRTADMNNRRWYSSGVLLPTGDVLALNGADKDEVVDPGSEQPVRQAELFDADTKTWTPLSSDARDRTYHNSAVLLADGSVLVGGHSPIVAHYGNAHANYIGAPFANNFKDPSFEIYKPAYMFKGDRPTITGAPTAVGLGQTFEISSPDAASITSVVLSHLPATTHITDADARTIELPIVERTAGTLKVATPSSSNVLTDGYYYLFAIKGSGSSKVPSVASVVKASQNITAPESLSGSLTAPPAATASSVSVGEVRKSADRVVNTLGVSAHNRSRRGAVTVLAALAMASVAALFDRRRKPAKIS